MRTAILSVALFIAAGTAARAQGWAEKMFKDGTAHDFGTVPHGAQLFHRFTITNIYAVRMEITGLKSGCGCVSAIPVKRVLESRESTTIDVSMNASKFVGTKTVGVRVTVGPDFVSSAELKVTANSRPDIVFNPGQVNLGAVPMGQSAAQTVDVEYAGALDWKVDSVVAKGLPLDVSLKEAYRRPGRVGYQVRVSLKPDAPSGLLKDEIYLKTNDPNSPLVPMLVEANVQAALHVAPANLSLGTIKAGDVITRRVVLSGARDFRVLGVDTADGVSIEPVSAAAAKVQIVTLKCQVDQAGEFKREVKVRTDLQDAPVVVTIEGTVP